MYDIMNAGIDLPKVRMEDYSWTFYGNAKFGKSSITAMFPDPMFFQFEQGQNALMAKKAPVGSWKEFLNYIKVMEKAKKEGKPMPFKNAIIDTADVAWKMCQQYVCSQNGWEHPSDGDYGKGWDAVAEEFLMAMLAIENLGNLDEPIRCIYVSHFTDKEFKPKKADAYNKIVPSVPSGARKVIVDKVDFVIYCGIDKVTDAKGNVSEVRRMYARDNGEFEAGARLRYMQPFVEYGDSAREAFENLKLAFEEAVRLEFGDLATVERPKINREMKASDMPVDEKHDEKVDLDALKKELEKTAIKMNKEGVMEMSKITAMIKDITGSAKISKIEDVDKALLLRDAFQGK